MDSSDDIFNFEHQKDGPVNASDLYPTPTVHILSLVDPEHPVEIQDCEGALRSETAIQASKMTAVGPDTEAIDVEGACSNGSQDNFISEISNVNPLRQCHDDIPGNEFKVPLNVEDVQRNAHKLGSPPTIFPRDIDSYHVVRRFLFTTLTSEEWGIIEMCPIAIIATVKYWYGAGAYLRDRFERDDLHDLCPLAAVKGITEDPERICDMIATCVMRECRLHLEQKLQQKQERLKVQNDMEGENDGAKFIYESSHTTPRPKLPEEWTSRKRRSSSVYSKTTNCTPLRNPMGPRLDSTEVVEQESLTKVASPRCDTTTEPASQEKKPTLDQSVQRSGSSLRLISSVRSIKASVKSDQESAKELLPLKKGIRSMQNLWETFSNPHTLRLKSSKTPCLNECKTLRFEDAEGGSLPAIDECETKEEALHDSLMTPLKPESEEKANQENRSSEDRPRNPPFETPTSLSYTDILAELENQINHVLHPFHSDSDFKASRSANMNVAPFDRSKRQTWHLGDAASENGVLFLSPRESLESLAARSASQNSSRGYVDSEILLSMEEIDPEVTTEVSRDNTTPVPEQGDDEDDDDIDSLFDDERPVRQPRGLTLKEFLSQETPDNSYAPPTSSASGSKGNTIFNTFHSIQKRMWRSEESQTKTSTKELGTLSTTGADHGPVPRFKDLTDGAQKKMFDNHKEKMLPPLPPDDSMSRKLGRGVAKALRPLKPGRFR